MRIIMNCTGGGSHSMMLLDHTTVMDLKKLVERKEGVPVDQQLLLFAGQLLCPDSALLLDHLGLDKYSLAHEVVVYMQRQLAAPVLVYLCQPGPTPCQQQAEIVEAGSTLANIMSLLQRRQLSSRPFPTATAAATQPALPTQGAGAAAMSTGSSTRSSMYSSTQSSMDNSSGSNKSSSNSFDAAAGGAVLPAGVVVKRQDGSCSSKVRVTETCTVEQLQAAVQAVEGAFPTHLSFFQATDGCLHVVWGPSADSSSSSSSHMVHSRSSMPQGVMLVRLWHAEMQTPPHPYQDDLHCCLSEHVGYIVRMSPSPRRGPCGTVSEPTTDLSPTPVEQIFQCIFNK